MCAAAGPSGGTQLTPISVLPAFFRMHTESLTINLSIRYDVHSPRNRLCLHSLLSMLRQCCRSGQCVASAIDFRRLCRTPIYRSYSIHLLSMVEITRCRTSRKANLRSDHLRLASVCLRAPSYQDHHTTLRLSSLRTLFHLSGCIANL